MANATHNFELSNTQQAPTTGNFHRIYEHAGSPGVYTVDYYSDEYARDENGKIAKIESIYLDDEHFDAFLDGIRSFVNRSRAAGLVSDPTKKILAPEFIPMKRHLRSITR